MSYFDLAILVVCLIIGLIMTVGGSLTYMVSGLPDAQGDSTPGRGGCGVAVVGLLIMAVAVIGLW